MKLSKLLPLVLLLPVAAFAMSVDVLQNDADGLNLNLSWTSQDPIGTSLSVDTVGSFSLINRLNFAITQIDNPSETQFWLKVSFNRDDITFSQGGPRLYPDSLIASYGAGQQVNFYSVAWLTSWDPNSQTLNLHSVGKDEPQVYDINAVPDATSTLPLLGTVILGFLALRRRQS